MRVPKIKAASLEEHHERVWDDLTAAMNTLLTERDYDTINLGHIAERAGIARNTVYNYARDKAGLVVAIAARASGPFLETVTALAAEDRPATARLSDITVVTMRAFTENTIRLMLQPSTSGHAPVPPQVVEDLDGPFGRLLLAVERVVRDGVASGEFRQLDDVRMTVALLGGAARLAAERMARDRLDPSRVAAAVNDLVLHALRP